MTFPDRYIDVIMQDKMHRKLIYTEKNVLYIQKDRVISWSFMSSNVSAKVHTGERFRANIFLL